MLTVVTVEDPVPKGTLEGPLVVEFVGYGTELLGILALEDGKELDPVGDVVALPPLNAARPFTQYAFPVSKLSQRESMPLLICCRYPKEMS